MKNIWILYMVILFTGIMQAQQEVQHTQYLYNPIAINPGYTGSKGYFTGILMHRQQWLGVKGAPQTQAFSVHMPLKKKPVSLGGSIINDKLGPVDELSLDANVAYTLQFSKKSKLGLGIKAGASFYSLDFDGVLQTFPDAHLQANLNSQMRPIIGAGAFYYTDVFYAGLSIPNLLQTKYYKEETQTIASKKMHTYIMSGYVFDITSELQCKPAILAKLVAGAPIQIDYSVGLLVNKKVALGIGYRVKAAFSGMAAFRIKDTWTLGYAYDVDTNKLNRFSSGSHEIFLQFHVLPSSKSKKKKKQLRKLDTRFF